MGKSDGYQFGPYQVDIGNSELFREGQPIPTRGMQLELLLLLINNAGNVVLKETIMDQLWPGLAVEESNLTQLVYNLRRLLGDSPRNSQYILTVSGRGYVFIHPVSPISADELPKLDPDGRTLDPDKGEAATPSASPSGLPGRYSWQRHRRIILILLVVVGGGLLLVVGLNIGPGRELRRLRVVKSMTVPGPLITPDVSPDGRMIAYSSLSENGENEDLYLSAIDREHIIQVTTDQAADSLPVWSPDGKRLAFLRRSKREEKARLMIVSLAELVEKDVGSAEDGLAWTPDGLHLIVTDHEEGMNGSFLYQVAIATGYRRRLTNSDQPGIYDSMPRFSSNGQTLAFRRSFSDSSSEICLLDPATGRLIQVTSDHRLITSFQWGLRGGGFYYVSNKSGQSRLWHIFIHSRNSRPVNQLPIAISRFDLSSVGEWMVYSRQIDDRQIEITDLSGTDDADRMATSCLINSSGINDCPVFSPDGQTIAFVSDRSGTPEIWTANSHCQNLTRITDFNDLRVGNPGWSRDGTRIVFDRTINGQSEIFTIRADGRDLRRLTTNDWDDLLPSWSADGQWIYFTEAGQNRSGIYRLPAGGGDIEKVVAGDARQSFESSDGLKLYFMRGGRLWRRDHRDGQEQIVQTGHDSRKARFTGSWHMAAGGIYFIADSEDDPIDQSAPSQLERLDLKTGRLTLVKPFSRTLPRQGRSFSLSPDERKVALAFQSSFNSELTVVKGWKISPIGQYLMDWFHLEQIFVHVRHDWFSQN